MRNSVLILAVLLLVGTATAISFPPYVENTLHRASCVASHYEYLIFVAGEIFGAPNMGELHDDLWGSYEAMFGYAEDGDMAGFNAEYANFTSIANEIRWSYFYYGIMEDYPFSDLWQNYWETQEGIFMCYAGGDD